MPRRLALCAAALAAVVAALPAGQARATPAPAGSGPVTVDASFFGGTTPPLTPGQIEVAVVSSLTSTVTGEDARIEVRGLAPADRLRVERDGTDVPGQDGALRGAGRVVDDQPLDHTPGRARRPAWAGAQRSLHTLGGVEPPPRLLLRRELRPRSSPRRQSRRERPRPGRERRQPL